MARIRTIKPVPPLLIEEREAALREIMAAIEVLVRARSPEQVRRMERDGGLR